MVNVFILMDFLIYIFVDLLLKKLWYSKMQSCFSTTKWHYEFPTHPQELNFKKIDRRKYVK